MERYEKYKDSGIEWVGEIPEHWKIVPIKRLVGEENSLFLDGDWIESKDIVFDTDGIRYITTGNIGEGIYKEQGLGYITQDTFDKLNCTEVLPFDLVISRLNPPIGRCCIIPDLGKKIVTSVDNVILRPNKNFNKSFLKYVMSNEKYFEYTSLIARGATMQRISRSLLGDINIPVSFDFDEQTNIATYLDRKTAEIDRIIANKQKLIALYEEEKQAIINQTVTKGVKTHGVRLKDSGVEWLGEIPEHWEVKKLKLISHKIGDGIHTTPNYLSGTEMYFINGVNLNNGSITITDNTMSIPVEEYEKYKIELSKGTLLISLNGTIGKLAIYNEEKVVFGKSAAFIELKDTIFNLYVFYLFKTQYIDNYFEDSFSGTTIKNLSLYTLRNTPIPILSFKEQQSIVAHIEIECARLDAIIEKFNKQIDLLKEYRTTLISEVVTGKMKVDGIYK